MTAGIIAADPAVVKAACETVQAAIVPDDCWHRYYDTKQAVVLSFHDCQQLGDCDKKWVGENGGWDDSVIPGRTSMVWLLRMIPSALLLIGPFKLDKICQPG